jgi:hypothetical protein
MYGIVNNGLYDVDGRFEAAAPVGRGVFVTPSYVNKTAAVPVADGAKDVYFVINEVTTPKELGVDDNLFVVAAGVKLKLAKFQLGATFSTTEFAAAPAIGDVLMVGVGGGLVADNNGVFKATVIETIPAAQFGGEPAVKCIVTAV